MDKNYERFTEALARAINFAARVGDRVLVCEAHIPPVYYSLYRVPNHGQISYDRSMRPVVLVYPSGRIDSALERDEIMRGGR